jgi:LPS-assembly lipoprotein
LDTRTVVTTRRRFAELLLAGLALPTLAACGFRPLYGRGGAGGRAEVREALAQIRVRPIADRQGQKLRQILREKLASSDAGAAVELDVRLGRQVQELGVRPDSTTSRANLIFNAGLTLFENGERVYADGVQSVVSYNILDDQYGTVASQSDAEDRALRVIGDEIRIRLAVFYDRRLATRK